MLCQFSVPLWQVFPARFIFRVDPYPVILDTGNFGSGTVDSMAATVRPRGSVL